MKGKIVCIFVALVALIAVIAAIVVTVGDRDVNESSVQNKNNAASGASVNSFENETEVVNTVSIPLDNASCCN